MKIKKIAAIAGVVALSGIAAGAYAHSRSGGFGGGLDAERIADRMAERIDKRLDLTDEQESELEKVLAAHAVKIKDELGTLKQDASISFAGTEFTADDAKAIIVGTENMHESMRAHMAETIAEVHGILTPEQREQAVALLSERGGLMHPGLMRGGHRGHRDGRHGRKH